MGITFIPINLFYCILYLHILLSTQTRVGPLFDYTDGYGIRIGPVVHYHYQGLGR